MKARRLEREHAWICRMQSIYPFGLNSKAKTVGIVNRSDGLSCYNIFEFGRNYDKMIKRRKQKYNPLRVRRFGDDNEVHRFLTIELPNTPIQDCLHLVRNRSKKFLSKCIKKDEYIRITPFKKKIIEDRIDFKQQYQNPKLKKKDTKGRMRFEVNFIHKSIQTINLRRIIGERTVKATIPPQCKFNKMPIFYYKYQKNISQKIFNYNKATRETDFADINEINALP